MVETPQVKRYQDLVFSEWWTDAELVTDENGNVELSAFAGDYDILIGDTTFEKTISTNAEGDILYLASSEGELIETVGEFKITKPLSDSIFAVNSPIEIIASYPDGSTNRISSVEFYLNGALQS